MTQRNPFATLSGYLAILCWAPAALLLSTLQHLPIMLVLAVSFSVCFIVIAIKLSVYQQWGIIRQTPWQCWLAGVLGIYGNNLCYLIAIQFAPIAHVVLIGYLWPITILFLGYYFLQQPISKRQIIASLIAFTGIAVLILHGGTHSVDSARVLIGYAFAFASGSLWAIYCVVSQYYQQTRGELIGLYCGAGALLSALLYAASATALSVNLIDITFMITLGLTAFGGAFLLWDYGLKRGNVKLLCVSAFFIPVLSTGLLIIFGQAVMTMALCFALACVTMGAYLAKS